MSSISWDNIQPFVERHCNCQVPNNAPGACFSWNLLKLLCDVLIIGLRFFQREKVSISFFPSLDHKVCEGVDVIHVAIPGKYYL